MILCLWYLSLIYLALRVVSCDAFSSFPDLVNIAFANINLIFSFQGQMFGMPTYELLAFWNLSVVKNASI